MFVSSRGLIKSCFKHNINPISSNSVIDSSLLEGHLPGESIYVCSDALIIFSENFLPLIQHSFVLVSGDSDTSINKEFLEISAISKILSNKYLVCWFAQNLATIDPKLVALPIGMDYHTMWQRPGFWGLTSMSPIAQENLLINTFSESPEFDKRYFNAYCNWKLSMNRGDRQDCFDKVDKSLCYFEESNIPRNSSWRRQSECMFVISPEGAGIDCHRTWEAILLGCIPIVKINPLTSLFIDLPVLLVNDWDEVRHDVMAKFYQSLPNRKFNFSVLFLQYWVAKIKNNYLIADELNQITMGDFRKIITKKTG